MKNFYPQVNLLKDGDAEAGDKVSAFTYQLHPERCKSIGDEKRPSKVYMVRAFLDVLMNGRVLKQSRLLTFNVAFDRWRLEKSPNNIPKLIVWFGKPVTGLEHREHNSGQSG